MKNEAGATGMKETFSRGNQEDLIERTVKNAKEAKKGGSEVAEEMQRSKRQKC